MTTVDGIKLHEEGTPREAFNKEWFFKGPNDVYVTYKFYGEEEPQKRKSLFLGDWRDCTGEIDKDLRHSGPNSSNWNGGLLERNGQIYVKMYTKHPDMDSRGYVRQHVLEMEEELGRYLWSFERVYHRDENKMNNAKENLGIRHIFEGCQRRWYVDQNGDYVRWSTKGMIVTKDHCSRIIPREFSKKIHTDATMPPYPFWLYDHVTKREFDTKAIHEYVGTTCKLCGKPHWQNVTKQNNTIDYDQICKDCTKFRLLRNWQTVEKTPYWMETGKDILVTFQRGGRYCYLANMRFDMIQEPLAKVLCTMNDIQFWVMPVDNSTSECIVKEA